MSPAMNPPCEFALSATASRGASPASLRLTSASFQPGKPDICVASGAHGQSLASFRNTAAGFFPYGNSWLMRPEAQSWSCSRWNGTCGRHGFSSQAMRP